MNGMKPSLLGLFAVLASVAGIVLTGCDVSGVTRTPSVARITNDLSQSVRLRLCSSNDCSHGFYPPDETLAPTDSWPVNVSSIGVPNVYLVQRPDGTRLGCLPLVSPELRHTEITVRVSEHVACRAHIDEHSYWPRRWKEVG